MTIEEEYFEEDTPFCKPSISRFLVCEAAPSSEGAPPCSYLLALIDYSTATRIVWTNEVLEEDEVKEFSTRILGNWGRATELVPLELVVQVGLTGFRCRSACGTYRTWWLEHDEMMVAYNWPAVMHVVLGSEEFQTGEGLEIVRRLQDGLADYDQIKKAVLAPKPPHDQVAFLGLLVETSSMSLAELMKRGPDPRR